MKHQIGLALSGGGVRGVAHLGVLKFILELDIHPTIVSGTSAGAQVGALYAAGHSPEMILSILKQTKIFKFSHYTYSKPGIIDTLKLKTVLDPYLPENSFEGLPKKLFVSATDLIHSKLEIFDDGPLIEAVLASSAFPMFFSPVPIGEKLYADGGIINNFPVEPLIGNCEKIIGSYVSPLKLMEVEDFKSALTVSERAYDLSIHSTSMNKFSHCDILLKPPALAKYGLFDFKNIDRILEIGYQEAKKHKAEIENLMR